MEIVAVFFTVVCIFLAGRNNVHTWWTGIIACISYGFVFFDAKLYADMILQVFFVATSIRGWVLWVETKDKPAIPITTTPPRFLLAYAIIGGVVLVMYTMLLKTFTDAYAPGWDSAVLVLSVIAQLMLMRRKLENWYVWIAVNTIAVPLFWNRELYLSSVLYAVFWFHAWYATYRWNIEEAATKFKVQS
jgi:nicotinamide mononucleotide transporter